MFFNIFRCLRLWSQSESQTDGDRNDHEQDCPRIFRQLPLWCCDLEKQRRPACRSALLLRGLSQIKRYRALHPYRHPRSAFAVEGKVPFYAHAADSGNTVSKGFCGTCGSPIYSTNSGYPGAVSPRASVLDDPNGVQPQMVAFANCKVAWDTIDDTLPAFDHMAPG
uniref:GFA family protein n=1 Tax=Yoonia sediminilitoris TaxID=1286148 RepID=UPI001FEC4DB2|nr:GFA family protein [Yoonia sediminilitoris]